VSGTAVPPAGTRAPVLRPYRPGDIEALYDICTRTGDNGRDASAKLQRPELLGDIYVGPYVRFEPGLAFVLDDGTRAVGYVLGTADTSRFVRRYRDEWLPIVAPRYPQPAGPPGTPDDQLLAVLTRPEAMLRPELSAYPAHLHIDILPPYQGAGSGRRLIAAFIPAAAAAGAPGVHVAVGLANVPAHGFYQKVGFVPLEVQGVQGARYYGRRTSEQERPVL